MLNPTAATTQRSVRWNVIIFSDKRRSVGGCFSVGHSVDKSRSKRRRRNCIKIARSTSKAFLHACRWSKSTLHATVRQCSRHFVEFGFGIVDKFFWRWNSRRRNRHFLTSTYRWLPFQPFLARGTWHPYLVLKVFGGTPSSSNRYKDQGIVIFGGTPGTSSRHPSLPWHPSYWHKLSDVGWVSYYWTCGVLRTTSYFLCSVRWRCGDAWGCCAWRLWDSASRRFSRSTRAAVSPRGGATGKHLKLSGVVRLKSASQTFSSFCSDEQSGRDSRKSNYVFLLQEREDGGGGGSPLEVVVVVQRHPSSDNSTSQNHSGGLHCI